MALQHDIALYQDETFQQVVRWETEPPKYVPIQAIDQGAPARITAASHGIPEGWPVAVVSVRGMTEINAAHAPPRDDEWHRAYVIDSDTVELKDVNAAEFSVYESGGYLMFMTPVDLVGYTAQLTIKDKAGGTVLASFTDDEGGGLEIDTTAHTVTISISVATLAAYSWKKGVYDLELVSPDGVTTALMRGKASVTKE